MLSQVLIACSDQSVFLLELPLRHYRTYKHNIQFIVDDFEENSDALLDACF